MFYRAKLSAVLCHVCGLGAAALFVVSPCMARTNEAPSLVPTPSSEPPHSMTMPTLDFSRVFASPSLAGAVPRMAALSPDGRWLTLLRARADNRERYDLWAYDRGDDHWRMLVDSAALSPHTALSETEKMRRERLRIGELQGVVSYAWAPDSRALLVPLDGALFLVGLDGSVKLIEDGSALLAPSLSAKGHYISFLRDRRVWVSPVAGGAALAITPEELSPSVRWGEAEFVAQEEMDRQDGLWWAPDDSRLAVERFDGAKVGEVTRASIGAAGTTTFVQRYPAAGMPNVAVSLWVMKPDGSERVKVDLGSDEEAYLARVDWAPDAHTLYVQRENRAQNRLDMLRVDPKTGASSLVFSEIARRQPNGARGWINLSDSYRFLKDGSLIWWSERDGFGHLYHYSPADIASGSGATVPEPPPIRQLTGGPWVVTDLVGVDEAHHRLFFTASRDDPLASQIYRLDYSDAKAQPVEITDRAFVNQASMDKAGQTLLVSRASTEQPPQVYLADHDGKRLAWVAENRLDSSHPYAPWMAAHRPTHFGTIRASDGSELHWKMITPEMKPGKKYPVFFFHYGGPHAQVVTRGWGGALEQAIVAKGYIYFALDNRGSANRGTVFEGAIADAMGTVEVKDQKAGAEYLKGLAFVDPAKIAIFGWSYGGYMTLKMLEADAGLYAAGIAVAPVTRWELYDTHYTERYLGLPLAGGDVYGRADALDGVTRIKDPLLLIHGLADDNVVFEHSSLAIGKMQAAEVPFEMMLYPGQTHAIGGATISVHLWNSVFAFLARHGVTPP